MNPFNSLARRIWKLMISRKSTSIIHYVIDNWLPTAIRENRFFMYPFFALAYKGKNVKKYMEFKANYYNLDSCELGKLYENYNPIGMERDTSLTPESICHILKHLGPSPAKILDVACGNGFLATLLMQHGYQVVAADLCPTLNIHGVEYHQANLESLPFTDNSFDVVVSTHTIEHVIDIRKAVKELIRVAKSKVVIVVPCQRFFYYTLDLHLHFFPKKEMLENLIGIENHSVEKIGGDWVYIGHLNKLT